MKKIKFESTKEMKDFNKMMKEMLLNGRIMTMIKDKDTDEVYAKVTTIRINGNDYFGFWEKAVFEEDDIWFLSSIGDNEKVEKEWTAFRNGLLKSGIIRETEAA